MQIIPYNDSRLQYLGRWNDTGIGIWSGWPSNWVLLKINNATYIDINVDIIDNNNSDYTAIICQIDNTLYWITCTTNAETYIGNKTVRINIPDINEHIIMFHTGQYYYSAYNQLSKITIKEYYLDDLAILLYASIPLSVQCIGDSWMGTTNDWPRYMENTLYKLYQFGIPGAMCSDMNGMYEYDYNGHINTTDSIVDAVMVSFGTNDYSNGVTQASFESSLNSLVNKIRTKQPVSPIYLIRCVDNRYLTPSTNNYGKYGVNMANVAAIINNVKYIDTSSLDSTITWLPDNAHLDSAGKQMLADYVNNYILIDLNIYSKSTGYIIN